MSAEHTTEVAFVVTSYISGSVRQSQKFSSQTRCGEVNQQGVVPGLLYILTLS